MNIRLTAGLLVVVMIVMLTGCGGIQESLKSWEETVKTPVSDSDVQVPDGLVKASDDNSLDLSEKIKIELYFTRKDGKGLAIEQRSINKVEGIARATINELLKGPAQKDLHSALPEGTELLDINVRPDGQCIINFSGDLENISGDTKSKLAVYSVVDTLCQFPTIDNVVFQVNGTPIENVGEVALAEPVMANYDLCKGNP
ncbi:MAG: GerMN domain-containing protein [Candidatus Saccharibacteria bacterium]